MNNYYQRPTGINWVQGIEGAKAYQIMPGGNAMMLDSENDGIFYIKTADNIGMCNLRTFKYQEVVNEPKQSADLSQYVTKAELNEILEKLNGGMNE